MGQHTQKSNLDFEALSAQCSNPKEKRHDQKGIGLAPILLSAEAKVGPAFPGLFVGALMARIEQRPFCPQCAPRVRRFLGAAIWWYGRL